MTLVLRAGLIAMLVGLSGAAAADPLGTWQTENGRSRIRIAACPEGLCGTIVWLKEPNDPETGKPKTDKNNAELSPTSLKLEGCALGGLICKGQTWTRAN